MSGRWGGRSSDRSGARDIAMDGPPYTAEPSSRAELEAAYKEGSKAETDGKSRDDNPYKIDDRRYREWLAGFNGR